MLSRAGSLLLTPKDIELTDRLDESLVMLTNATHRFRRTRRFRGRTFCRDLMSVRKFKIR